MAAIRMNNGVPILNGSTLAFDDNENCCCSPADTNACTGVTCPTVNGTVDPPSMLLTVSGASGTINWGGKTWNLPADSGLEQCACPSLYLKQRGTGTSIGYNDVDAVHRWQAGDGGANEILKLERGYNVVTFFSLWYRANFGDGLHRNVNYLRVRDATDFQIFYNSASGVTVRPPVPVTYTNTSITDLNKVIGVPYATYSNYTLTNAYTQGTQVIGGITYEWKKGLNWV